MAKIIIGISGEMASGKDTVKKYLAEKYKASSYKLSSLVRDVLKVLCLPDTRGNMNGLSVLLRKNFGEDIFSRVMFEAVKNDINEYIVIDGVRRIEDLKYLNNLPGFSFIYVESDLEKRYERIVKRKENPDDINKSPEDFRREHLEDAETQITGLKEYADFVVENNGTLEELHEKIDGIISKNKNK